MIIVKRHFIGDWCFLSMIIPDVIRDCVAFIGHMCKGEMSAIGSGFFLAKQLEGTERYVKYLITAQHVINKTRDESDDQIVRVKVNMKDGPAKWIPTDIDEWKFHPEDPRNVDVAALSIYPTDDWNNAQFIGFDKSVAKDESSLRGKIGLGDEVNIVGLFSESYGRMRNYPIVRCGTIARMPDEKIPIELSETDIGETDAYLIETHSTGGLSGSPVFLNVSGVRYIDGEPKFRESLYFLLGLVHGHWNMSIGAKKNILAEFKELIENINTGISVVIPAAQIFEVLEREEFVREREEAREEIIRETMPTPKG